MVYSYKVTSTKGQYLNGFLAASSAQELQKLFATFGFAIRELKIHWYYTLISLVRPKQFAVQESSLEEFSVQLRDLLEAGIPLAEMLRIISNSASKPSLRAAVSLARYYVEECGADMPKALQAVGFPEFYTSQLAIGAETGNFQETLERLVDFYTWKIDILSQVRKLLIYPAALLIFLVIFLFAIIVFVVPKLRPIFEGVSDLPIITRTIMWLGSGELFANPLLATLFIITFITGFSFIIKFAKTQLTELFYRTEPTTTLGRNPLFRFFYLVFVLVYINALQSGISSGFSLQEVLQKAASVLPGGKDSYLKKASHRAGIELSKGRDMAEALKPILIDESLLVFLKTAAESGNLLASLNRLAITLDRQIKRYIEPASNIIKFGALIIVGVVITMVIYAIYFPMYMQMINAS